MIVRLTVAQASIVKELCTSEFDMCLDRVRQKRASATSNPYDRSEHVANLYECRAAALIDILNELADASRL